MSKANKSQNRIQKEHKVSVIAEKIAKSKSLVFADYRGMTVAQFSDLRQKVKAVGGEIEVTKNTLLTRALQNLKFKITNDKLEGPTATLFSYQDEIAPLKALSDLAKNFGLPKIKAGFLNHEYIDADELEQLSKLPSKEVLAGQVIGGLASPLYGITSVLQANIRNLVSILDQRSKKIQN